MFNAALSEWKLANSLLHVAASGLQVLAISGLWNTAMAHPNDPEFIELGIFECMAQLIWKGIEDRHWLAQDQNIYIPYYAAHIIGSYTMNMEEFAEHAVRAGNDQVTTTFSFKYSP